VTFTILPWKRFSTEELSEDVLRVYAPMFR
jgi:hypothetical protein